MCHATISSGITELNELYDIAIHGWNGSKRPFYSSERRTKKASSPSLAQNIRALIVQSLRSNLLVILLGEFEILSLRATG